MSVKLTEIRAAMEPFVRARIVNHNRDDSEDTKRVLSIKKRHITHLKNVYAQILEELNKSVNS